MIEEMLRGIGLTENETKVYLALLDLGESKTGEILKKSGLNSGKIYEILDALQKKGLVSFVVKNGIKQFSPADPKRVLDYLEEKKQAVVKEEEDYQKILPNLLKKVALVKPKSKIEIFTGLKGMKTAYAKELNYPASETLYVLGVASSKSYAKEVWNYFNEIHRPKREKAGYKIKKLLSEEAFKERIYHEKTAEVRYLPQGFIVSMSIIKDLCLLSIFTEEMIFITIESQEVADNFKRQFEILWRMAEEKVL